jgi:hypothetical protein
MGASFFVFVSLSFWRDGNVYIDQHISTKKEQSRLVSFCLLLLVLTRLVVVCFSVLFTNTITTECGCCLL